eukprot:7764969-Pyramimonas_sp.AAC.1
MAAQAGACAAISARSPVAEHMKRGARTAFFKSRRIPEISPHSSKSPRRSGSFRTALDTTSARSSAHALTTAPGTQRCTRRDKIQGDRE